MFRVRISGLLVLTLATALSAGCLRSPRSSAPPLEFRVRASAPIAGAELAGSVEPAPVQPVEPFLLPQQFIADGKGAFPQNSSSRVQRLAIAEAEARRNALRKLADQILSYKPKDDRTIRELTSGLPDWEQRLTELLETQSQSDYLSSANEVIARVAIDGSAVLQSLQLRPDSASRASSANSQQPQDRDAARAEAREVALEAARKLLQSEVMKVETPQGTIQTLTFRHAGFAEELDILIDNLEPEDVSFQDSGACVVTLALPWQQVEAILPR